MDSLITAAARALAAGDPLGALKRVALNDDAPALALRGIVWRSLAISFEQRLSTTHTLAYSNGTPGYCFMVVSP